MTSRISVLVKFAPADLAVIDAARGPLPRMAWIVAACAAATKKIADPRLAKTLDGATATLAATYAEPPDPPLPTSGRGNTERGVKGPPKTAEPITRVAGPGRALPPRPRPIKGYDSQGKPIYR